MPPLNFLPNLFFDDLTLIRLDAGSAPLEARARAALQGPFQNCSDPSNHIPATHMAPGFPTFASSKQCVRGSSRRWPPPRGTSWDSREWNQGTWSGGSVRKARALSLGGAPFHQAWSSHSLMDQAMTRQTTSHSKSPSTFSDLTPGSAALPHASLAQRRDGAGPTAAVSQTPSPPPMPSNPGSSSTNLAMQSDVRRGRAR